MSQQFQLKEHNFSPNIVQSIQDSDAIGFLLCLNFFGILPAWRKKRKEQEVIVSSNIDPMGG